jgi:hypothetical protein
MSISYQTSATPAQPFQYGQVISMMQRHSSGGYRNRHLYCADENTCKLILQLAKNKHISPWRKTPLLWTRIKPLNLVTVSTPCGWLAHRLYRRLEKSRALAHVLSDSPILFPDPELAQAAAELCFPYSPPALGCMGWTTLAAL